MWFTMTYCFLFFPFLVEVVHNTQGPVIAYSRLGGGVKGKLHSSTLLHPLAALMLWDYIRFYNMCSGRRRRGCVIPVGSTRTFQGLG